MTCRIFPKLSDESLDDLSSNAEAKFYRACRDQLPSEFLVLHSLSMIFEKTINDGHAIGESDFIIFNPHGGVLVVEVKGGGIRYDPMRESSWFSIDRSGIEYKIQNPFEQSKNYQFRVLDLIKKRVRGLKNTHFPLGHSVAFPDVRKSALGQIISHNRPKEIIACAEDLADLETWYDGAHRFWSGKQKIQPLSREGVREVERVFLKPVFAKPSVSAILDEEETARIKLTEDQARLLFCLEHHDRVNIIGGAGTGKTVLAKKAAEKFSIENKRTALICYNKGLGDELGTAFSNTMVHAGTYHSFFMGLLGDNLKSFVAEAKEAYPKADLWQVVMPFAFIMALENNEKLKFDAVIIDEGQDFNPEMWLSLEMLLKDDASKMFVFSDTHQGLYSKIDNIPKLSPPFLLQTNCRNTLQIFKRAYEDYDGPPITPPSIQGEQIQEKVDSSVNSQVDYICNTLNKLCIEGDVDKENVVILVADSQNLEGCMKHLVSACSKIKFVEQEHVSLGKVRVSTVKRFKGLEAPVVILWGAKDIPGYSRKEIYYVGLTRAKSRCFLVN